MTRRAGPLGDGSESAAARQLGLAVPRFRELLPRLEARGFPPPDPDTGNFDLDAVRTWRERRYPHLFRDPIASRPEARDAADVVKQRLAAMHG